MWKTLYIIAAFIIAAIIYAHLGTTILVYVFAAIATIIYLAISNSFKPNQCGNMRQTYAVLINACNIGNAQILNESRDMISLKTGSRNSTMFMTISQNADYVSIDVIVANVAIGKVHKMFSFPTATDQNYMVQTINQTMAALIDKKMNEK